MNGTDRRRLVTIGASIAAFGWVLALVLFLTHQEGRGRFIEDTVVVVALVGLMLFVRRRTRDM